MAHFDVDDESGLFDDAPAARVWRACNDGEIREILFKFAAGDARLARAPPDRATRAVIKFPRRRRPTFSLLVRRRRLSKKTRRLRNTLLDKFVAMGGPTLRHAVKHALSRYDADGSGELEKGECVRALRGLLPGVADAELQAVIDSIDTDNSATLTVDEITTFLLAAQDQRDPQATSLGGI